MTLCGVSAKHLTPQEALSRAVSQPVNGIQKAPANAASMEIRRVLLNPDDAATVYVFASDGNALVVPADDRVAPVLGYIDGCANGEIPPQMEWWLSEYSRQIDYVMSRPEKGTGLYVTLPVKAESDTKAPIEPLVTTRWNQDSPYNYNCPTVSGYRSMTGCVATAAAQVMKYHNYPAEGTGTISYKDGNSNTTRTLKLDGKPFDWDNMLDSYSGTYTAAQRDAVAYLMQAVGYASEMAYSPQASGAQSPTMLEGVKKYFGYNEKAVMLNRQDYPLAQWEDLVYENLKTVGPVYYAGDDAIQGGHAFVCDGYSSDGFFHFNWGWGGSYDGYFKLTALTPEGQGIGGNAGGFNFGQEIVLNFTKPDAPTIDIPATSPVTLTGSLTASKASGTTLNISSDMAESEGVFAYNSTGATVKVEFGLKAVNMTSGEEEVRGDGSSVSLDMYVGYSSMRLSIPANLPTGSYRMYLVTRDYPDGEWLEVRHDISCANYVNVTISNGSISRVSNVGTNAIEGYDLTALTAIYMSNPLKISYSIENNGETEIYDGIMPVIFTITNNSANIKGMGDAYAVDILPGESREVETIATMYPLQGSDSFSGQAYLGIVSQNSGMLLEYIPVTVKTATTLDVSATTFTMEGDRNNANPDNLRFNCGLEVTSGYWAAPLTVYICKSNGEVIQTLSSSETFFLDADQSATATVSGTLPDAKTGTLYNAIFGYVEGYYVQSLGMLTFKVKSGQSGVEETSADTAESTLVIADRANGILSVVAPSDIASVEVFTLDGRSLSPDMSVDGTSAGASLSTLPAGILLVKVTLADGSVFTAKVAN